MRNIIAAAAIALLSTGGIAEAQAACTNSVVASGITMTVGGGTKNFGAANPNGCAFVTPGSGAAIASPGIPGVFTAAVGSNGWIFTPVAPGSTTVTFSAPGYNPVTVNLTVQPATLDVISF
jgi:hypothetical protein